MGECYVYTLAYPDGTVFYVGKGSGNRIKAHFWEALGKKKTVSRVAQRIREIWLQGGKVIIRKPYRNIDSLTACDLETALIEQYGYEQLVNNPWSKHRKQLNDALKKTDEMIAKDGAIII